MATRAVTVGAVSGTAGISSEAGLAGVPRLLEDLARLSEDKDTADIVFLLGRDETPVYAHRIILQARSVFYSSFLDTLQLISFLRPRIISLLIRKTCEIRGNSNNETIYIIFVSSSIFFTASRDETNKFESFL